MKRIKFIMATILAMGLGAQCLRAAETTQGKVQEKATKESAQDKTVAEDFAKLSADGHLAFEDIDLARQAIFDGDPQTAVKLVTEAQQALARAKTDDSVFLKDASLGTPVAPAKTAEAAKSEPEASKPADTSAPKTIAWIPVDGEFILNETLTESRVKSAAVATANRHLRQGKVNKAHDVLKITGAEADFILVVAPLDDTTNNVTHAASLLASGDYYNANLALRQAQQGLRFVSKDVVATKDGASKEAPKSGGTKPEAK